jgi:flagellar assembly protein FliH
MKPRRELLHLTVPMRDVKIVRSADRATVQQQDLQAHFEQGRLEGERALAEQLLRQRAEILELQNGVLASLREVVPQVVRDCESGLVQLALEAAQRVVGGLPISTELIETAIREVCAEVEDTAEFTIQLHPEDLKLLEQSQSPLLQPPAGRERIHFLPSQQVTRGGCVVQTPFGLIDARRETRFELLRQSVSA